MLLLGLYSLQLIRPCANDKQSIWRSPIVLRQCIWQIAISLLWLITMPIITFLRENDKHGFKNVKLEIKPYTPFIFCFPYSSVSHFNNMRRCILNRSILFDMIVVYLVSCTVHDLKMGAYYVRKYLRSMQGQYSIKHKVLLNVLCPYQEK